MKVRELVYSGFRGVGETPRRVSFVDEATGEVRPLTVLVGSNGCGKTTVLELIYALFTNFDDDTSRYLRAELEEADAKAAIALDGPFPHEGQERERLVLSFPYDSAESDGAQLMTLFGALLSGRSEEEARELATRQRSDRDWLKRVERGVRYEEADFRDGLLYFPHFRWIEHQQVGAIAPPSERRDWNFRLTSKSSWGGSLAQLWVWQNYLDLEAGAEGRPNLAPFVEVIEEILGEGQRVRIRRGHVSIERPHIGDSVEPHQLPSGQQQILTLFGELARRMRPGAVVLIDEIELSLHPALQRAVIHHLRRLAKKYDLQIIVTTHSMEIVSAVAPHEVVNLDDMVLHEEAARRDVG